MTSTGGKQECIWKTHEDAASFIFPRPENEPDAVFCSEKQPAPPAQEVY
jgi:hypothetical protein